MNTSSFSEITFDDEPDDETVQTLVEQGWEDFYTGRPNVIWADISWYWLGWGMAHEAEQVSKLENAEERRAA
jgi:hypothetical protein